MKINLRVTLALSAFVLAGGLISVAAPSHAGELDPIQMMVDGWAEEHPGVWVKTLESGERRLQARGPEALRYVLQQLRGEAKELLEADFGSTRKTGRLDHLLSVIADLEDGLERQRPAKGPECDHTAIAIANAGSGPNCGVSGSALATVTSDGDDCQPCRIYAGTYAESACSPTGSVSGPGSDCEKLNVYNDRCSSYSQSDRPFRCDAAAGAIVYCPGADSINLAFYDEVDTCQGSGACGC